MLVWSLLSEEMVKKGKFEDKKQLIMQGVVKSISGIGNSMGKVPKLGKI